jgi:hypothetical protein
MAGDTLAKEGEERPEVVDLPLAQGPAPRELRAHRVVLKAGSLRQRPGAGAGARCRAPQCSAPHLIVERVHRCLDAAQIPPDRVVLELHPCTVRVRAAPHMWSVQRPCSQRAPARLPPPAHRSCVLDRATPCLHAARQLAPCCSCHGRYLWHERAHSPRRLPNGTCSSTIVWRFESSMSLDSEPLPPRQLVNVGIRRSARCCPLHYCTRGRQHNMPAGDPIPESPRYRTLLPPPRPPPPS